MFCFFDRIQETDPVQQSAWAGSTIPQNCSPIILICRVRAGMKGTTAERAAKERKKWALIGTSRGFTFNFILNKKLFLDTELL